MLCYRTNSYKFQLFKLSQHQAVHVLQKAATYEGVSKSPRTMLITRKSPVVHGFPARVCCGGVL